MVLLFHVFFNPQMIIGVINQKGGVGKTTLSINIADTYARTERKQVLLVDADPQCSSLAWAESRDEDTAFPVIAMATDKIWRDLPKIAEAYDRVIIDGPPRVNSNASRYLVVSTQGRGDLAALEAALASRSAHIAFVGSRRKIAALRARLKDRGYSQTELERLKGPAGLDLGAITPEEIALSILAELLMIRRKGQRGADTHPV